jgi:hypothetical protein
VAAVALPVGGRAHPEFGAVTVNRYVKFDLVDGDELRLAYTVMVGAEPALVARKQADADGDGRIDAAEARALGERLRALVTHGIELTVDGARAMPGFDEPQVGLAGPEVAPSPFSVDLVVRLRLAPSGGAHLVRYDDKTELPQPGESEVLIEEGPRTRLLAAFRGTASDGLERRFLFRGPKFSALEDRSITFRFAAAPPPAAPTSAPRTSAGHRAGVAALAALLLIALVWGAAKRRTR